jgi:hypothetical protein
LSIVRKPATAGAFRIAERACVQLRKVTPVYSNRCVIINAILQQFI